MKGNIEIKLSAEKSTTNDILFKVHIEEDNDCDI